jgi:hypothetical protein
MAGSYSDVPDHRFAWDRDGSVGFTINSSSVLRAMTSGEEQALNSENGNRVSTLTWSTFFDQAAVGVIFPTLSDLAAYAFFGDHENPGGSAQEYTDAGVVFATSTDTSTGTDGTWTSQGSYTMQLPEVPKYRTSIVPLAVSGIKAIRFSWPHPGSGSTNPRGLHLYGTPTSTLRLWDSTLDQPVGAAAFDYGDVSPGSTPTRQFRVKNTHPTQTAHDITVTREALTDKTPSMVGSGHVFSIDGGPYATSLNIGDLAPGAVSNIVTVRHGIQGDAQAGLGAFRYVAQAASWS